MKFVDKICFAEEVIVKAIERHNKNKLFIASSFGKDSLVLIHIARKFMPEIKIFTILSDTEFEETYQYTDHIIKSWELNCVKIHFEQTDYVKDNPNLCCRDKKVDAMRTIVKDMDCWFSGVRRDEGSSRTEIQPVENLQGIEKINPLIHFSELDIWRYIGTQSIEVNPLYKHGYRSLGCKNCSTIEKNSDEHERDGRWSGLNGQAGECGIHTEKLKY